MSFLEPGSLLVLVWSDLVTAAFEKVSLKGLRFPSGLLKVPVGLWLWVWALGVFRPFLGLLL